LSSFDDWACAPAAMAAAICGASVASSSGSAATGSRTLHEDA